MQNEITQPIDLLNADGNIAQPGFAKKCFTTTIART